VRVLLSDGEDIVSTRKSYKQNGSTLYIVRTQDYSNHRVERDLKKRVILLCFVC